MAMARKSGKHQKKSDNESKSHFDNDHHPVVGIDLGTTYSCCARWDGRNPDIYEGLDRVANTPELRSAVYLEESGNAIVGQVAYNRFVQDPENGVVEIKREMGNHHHRVFLRGKAYSPAEISSMILGKIRDEIYGRFPPGKFSFGGVVVTHPFYFKGPQIEDTAKAAEMLGFNVLGLLPEPVAAALAYTLYYLKDHLELDKSETILVFDLGGGTFDTTLFELKESEDKLIFRGLSTGGDARLGGMDFNRALMDYVLRMERLDYAVLQGRDGIRARVRLEEQIEARKRDLAEMTKTYLAVPNILNGRHIEREISQDEFRRVFKGEEGGRNFYEDIREIIAGTLGKGRHPHVDRVLLVGGSTRVPFIRALIQEELPDAQIYANISESQAVGMGAAIYAAHLDKRLNYEKEIVIIPPGYAHDFGIKTHDGRFSKIIGSNSPLPAIYSEVFITPEDNCKLLSIEVYERDGGWSGDRIEADDTEGRIMRRGKIAIDGLPKHKKGEVEIVVRLTVERSDQVGVHIEVFHKKQKIREIDEDLRN
jgi:molecular chaperone DnaK